MTTQTIWLGVDELLRRGIDLRVARVAHRVGVRV